MQISQNVHHQKVHQTIYQYLLKIQKIHQYRIQQHYLNQSNQKQVFLIIMSLNLIMKKTRKVKNFNKNLLIRIKKKTINLKIKIFKLQIYKKILIKKFEKYNNLILILIEYLKTKNHVNTQKKNNQLQ
ncbi:hypothetical protein IMG5_000540 [Ichthyophthirius multifiliis]|uniref:Uncharacterized protein n=1 Tax=Ichthyophthirius multifiliis TaxID=5932 RepID=G0QIU1_ICHMU|nr:hypothetical protein IMG5_000540 [Ichthyophthirius multifiliis]EGR34827.1 hypothetical protein IMG5_000540 [Ichthyophthirius multifiliis]|eukprot:XP_004040131.1 hypothetical protein IMG5_000540 [Ichthyophthirius multifiliis]